MERLMKRSGAPATINLDKICKKEDLIQPSTVSNSHGGALVLHVFLPGKSTHRNLSLLDVVREPRGANQLPHTGSPLSPSYWLSRDPMHPAELSKPATRPVGKNPKDGSRRPLASRRRRHYPRSFPSLSPAIGPLDSLRHARYWCRRRSHLTCRRCSQWRS